MSENIENEMMEKDELIDKMGGEVESLRKVLNNKQ